MQTREQIEKVLIDCLKDLAGEDAPESFNDNYSVFRQWGLESDDGIDLAADLDLRLDVHIPLDDNPLVEENMAGQKRARSFHEVVDYMISLHASQGVR